MKQESRPADGLLRRGLSLVHHIDGERGVCDCASSPHLGGDPNGFHDLHAGGTFQLCAPGMAANAISALRHVGHRNRNKFFCFGGQRTVDKDLMTEGPEGL